MFFVYDGILFLNVPPRDSNLGHLQFQFEIIVDYLTQLTLVFIVEKIVEKIVENIPVASPNMVLAEYS